MSTLPYIPNDVPALALSFDWYSKAWWPRVKLEEFMLKYAAVSPAELRSMVDACADAVMGGVAVVSAYERQIPGFAGMGKRIAGLWKDRVSAFLSEQTALTSKGRSRKR